MLTKTLEGSPSVEGGAGTLEQRESCRSCTPLPPEKQLVAAPGTTQRRSWNQTGEVREQTSLARGCTRSVGNSTGLNTQRAPTAAGGRGLRRSALVLSGGGGGGTDTLQLPEQPLSARRGSPEGPEAVLRPAGLPTCQGAAQPPAARHPPSLARRHRACPEAHRAAHRTGLGVATVRVT